MNNHTVTGVDLGSYKVKIAAILKGGVEVITNEANFRQTPNVVGFLQSERLIGQEGQVKIKTNHSNTIIAPSRYMGFNKFSQSEFLKNELNFCPCRSTYSNPSQNDLKFIIPSVKDTFYPQQLVASYLNEIEKIISQTNSLVNRHMTISVPSYFTQHQRKALLNAIQIFNRQGSKGYQIQLIDEEVAISMDYGYSRRNQFSEGLDKSRNVLFIDFGHSKTNVFLTAFNKNHMRVLCNKFNRQMGCKFLDQELLAFYAQKFDKSHLSLDLNLLQSKKATLKLLDAVERQRKILSGINEHELNIECLLEEEDFNYSMKRDEYEKVCELSIKKFKQFLIEFVQQLKKKQLNFDLIQLIGGGTRIPIILQTINEVFNIQPSRTINSSECIAKGAALVSTMNSSIFKVNQYGYFYVNTYSINLKINGNVINNKIINKNQLIIKEKIFQFNVNMVNQQQKLMLQLQYEGGFVQNGLQKRIWTGEVLIKDMNKLPTSQDTKNQMELEQNLKPSLKLFLKITQDENGLYKLNSLTSENKLIILTMSQLNTFQRFSLEQIQEMEQKQKQMTIRDQRIKQFYEKKNQFEAFIYKSKENLYNFGAQNKLFMSELQVAEIEYLLNEEQRHLYEQGHSNLNKSQEFSIKSQLINEKIDKLMSCANHAKQAHLKVSNQLTQLMNYINQIINKKNPNMYPEQVNQVRQWVNSMIQEQKAVSKSKLPVVTVEQIRNVMQNLTRKLAQFDIQMQRQRYQDPRTQRKPHQQYTRHPESSYYQTHEKPNYHQQHKSYKSPYQSELYEPKPTKTTYPSNRNNFGSGFFGSGFSLFF